MFEHLKDKLYFLIIETMDTTNELLRFARPSAGQRVRDMERSQFTDVA